MKTTSEERRIEQLRKESEHIIPLCLGEGFTTDQAKSWTGGKCDRIMPNELLEIIDEETGATDPETAAEEFDETCYCSTYFKPKAAWKLGRCPMASHYNPFVEEEKAKVRVGQQKQKKKK